MNVPPPASTPRTTVLTSLPRALPPPVAAASLASTLRHARRRRLRRRAGQTAGTIGAAALAWVLALWGTNDFPTDAGTVGGGRTMAVGGGSKQGPIDGQGRSETGRVWASAVEPAAPAPEIEPAAIPALPAPLPVLAASVTPPSTFNSPAVPLPQPAAGAPKTPPASFVLVRSQPIQAVRTTPVPEPPAATAGNRASFTMVATAAVPAPMVITTRRTIAPQSIATADHDSTPEPATDADLFALADGRPAALCRLNSGGTRWFWLDQPRLQ